MSSSPQKKVEDEKLATRRATWKPIDENGLEDLPKLFEDQQRNILGAHKKNRLGHTHTSIFPEDRIMILKKKMA